MQCACVKRWALFGQHVVRDVCQDQVTFWMTDWNGVIHRFRGFLPNFAAAQKRPGSPPISSTRNLSSDRKHCKKLIICWSYCQCVRGETGVQCASVKWWALFGQHVVRDVCQDHVTFWKVCWCQDQVIVVWLLTIMAELKTRHRICLYHDYIYINDIMN